MTFLYPLFFTSGIPALLYQVVWQRSLFTIYGTNTESATAVVAAFLLGLGLGAFLGGWAASRWPTQLLIIYGVIEFVIGLFGFVSLQIFDWVGLRFTAASMAQTGIVASLARCPCTWAETARINATPCSPIRCRNYTRSLGSQGSFHSKSLIPQNCCQ